MKNTTYRSVGAKFLCAPTIRLAPARTVICGQSGTSYISENDKRWVNLLPRPADAGIIRVLLELHLSKQLAFLSFGSSWWRSRPQEKIKPQRRKGAKIRGKQKRKEKVKCALCFSSCPPTIAEQCCRNADASFCPWARFAYIFWDSETLYSSKRASASRVSCSGTPRNETVSALHRPPAPTHSPINAHPVHTQNIRFLNLARMFAEGQRRGPGGLLKTSADAARDPRPVERQFFFFFRGARSNVGNGTLRLGLTSTGRPGVLTSTFTLIIVTQTWLGRQEDCCCVVVRQSERRKRHGIFYRHRPHGIVHRLRGMYDVGRERALSQVHQHIVLVLSFCAYLRARYDVRGTITSWRRTYDSPGPAGDCHRNTV